MATSTIVSRLITIHTIIRWVNTHFSMTISLKESHSLHDVVLTRFDGSSKRGSRNQVVFLTKSTWCEPLHKSPTLLRDSEFSIYLICTVISTDRCHVFLLLPKSKRTKKKMPTKWNNRTWTTHPDWCNGRTEFVSQNSFLPCVSSGRHLLGLSLSSAITKRVSSFSSIYYFIYLKHDWIILSRSSFVDASTFYPGSQPQSILPAHFFLPYVRIFGIPFNFFFRSFFDAHTRIQKKRKHLCISSWLRPIVKREMYWTKKKKCEKKNKLLMDFYRTHCSALCGLPCSDVFTSGETPSELVSAGEPPLGRQLNWPQVATIFRHMLKTLHTHTRTLEATNPFVTWTTQVKDNISILRIPLLFSSVQVAAAFYCIHSFQLFQFTSLIALISILTSFSHNLAIAFERQHSKITAIVGPFPWPKSLDVRVEVLIIGFCGIKTNLSVAHNPGCDRSLAASTTWIFQKAAAVSRFVGFSKYALRTSRHLGIARISGKPMHPTNSDGFDTECVQQPFFFSSVGTLNGGEKVGEACIELLHHGRGMCSCGIRRKGRNWII